MSIKEKYLGSIHLGRTAYISDPCYTVGTWCQDFVDNMEEGEYDVYIGISEREKRVAYLEVKSESAGSGLEETLDDIGVDSGQAGVFDGAYFEANSDGDFDGWYGNVCKVTELDGGLIDGLGACSCSGYGDGSYPVDISRNDKGEVNHIFITFIEEDE